MDNYIKNYEKYTKKIVYNFNVRDGGIGDNIKYFMFLLDLCIKDNIRLYYNKNNIELEKYIKLKHDMMYINEDMLKRLDSVQVIKPQMLYSLFEKSSNKYNYSIGINDIFYFTEDVKINSHSLFSPHITNYISIHVRLGDKYLETDRKYIEVPTDTRYISEEHIHKYIEANTDQHIFFCADNNQFKLKLKEKYANIIITNCDIGHTSLSNTTGNQVLDAVTEFYILTNSKSIFAGSVSGFSIVAAKFNNIPLIST
jgi:hypothetical protein